MTDSTTAAPTGSLRGTLAHTKIVFLVVAAAAPMASMVGIVPLAFVLGAGAATPAAFAICGLILICFSVGYAAMRGRTAESGGFYPYVARGLGRPPAVAAALVAVIAYNAVAVELVAGLGYFGPRCAAADRDQPAVGAVRGVRRGGRATPGTARSTSGPGCWPC